MRRQVERLDRAAPGAETTGPVEKDSPLGPARLEQAVQTDPVPAPVDKGARLGSGCILASLCVIVFELSVLCGVVLCNCLVPRSTVAVPRFVITRAHMRPSAAAEIRQRPKVRVCKYWWSVRHQLSLTRRYIP